MLLGEETSGNHQVYRFHPEHLWWDQSVCCTPLSVTMDILNLFKWESPSPVNCFHMIVILNSCHLWAMVFQRVYNAAHCNEVSAGVLRSSYTKLSLFYYQELGMLSNQVVTSEEIPSPYVSLPRLTALVRYSKICLSAVFFEPSLKGLPDGLNHSCSKFLG